MNLLKLKYRYIYNSFFLYFIRKMGIFDFFKGKKEKDMLDLTNNKKEIPIPNDVEERLKETQNKEEPIKESQTETTPVNNFSGFFGSTTQNTQDSVNNSPSSSYTNYGTTNNATKVKVKDILEKISRLGDRIELLEKKIERLERR